MNCKEVATAVASDELETLGLRGRIAVWYHLLICKYCRAYVRQLRSLGEAARRLFGRDLPGADAESVARLEEKLVARCTRPTDAPDELS